LRSYARCIILELHTKEEARLKAKAKPRPGKKLPGGGAYRLVGLKAIREREGVSKLELSRRSGVSRNTVIWLERGDQVARATTVMRLAEGLGVEPLDLVIPIEEEEET
jgi:DNA-binding XRE family transcriptional regulator